MPIIDCYCPQCKHRTHHEVLGEGKNVSPDEDYYYVSYYRVVKCCGCDTVSFDREVIEEGNVEYNQDGYEEIVPVHTSYPVKEYSIEPLVSWEIPSLINRAYKESVDALNNESYLLASIGFRATIEALCLENGINSGNLADKIDTLRKKGIITDADCKRLHEVRFMGNDSAHQMEKTANTGLYECNQLSPDDCEKISVILRKVINKGRINCVTDSFDDNPKLVKVKE